MELHFAPAPVPTAPHPVYGTYHYAQVKEVADALHIATPPVGSDDPIPPDVLLKEAISKKSLAKFKDLVNQFDHDKLSNLDSLLTMSFLYAAGKGSVDIMKYLVEERDINVNSVDDELEV